MTSEKLFIASMFLIGSLLMAALDTTDAQIGVCYGMQGNGLPPASEVIEMYRQNGIRRMRLYDPDGPALEALRGSDIEVMLGVPNTELQNLAASQDNARTWVQNNVLNYPDVNFKYIAVGNEVSPFRETSSLMPSVLPAIRNIHAAISQGGKGDQIKVSTAIDFGLMTNTFPPSAGEFRPEARDYMGQIIDFLNNNGATLFLNLYPYFSRVENTAAVPLSYALLKEGADTPDGRYPNMLAAMLDGAYSAVEKVGGSSLRIIVSESGWPTEAGPETSVDNARTYNNNLIQSVKTGTLKRPGGPIETYIFAMFDEDRKGGAPSERHFGLFSPNKQPKYQVNFN